jgi:hypothetical protein
MSTQRDATHTEENHATRFLPVLDSRKRKIRGLIRRGDRYYAQLRVEIGNGASKPKRIPLRDFVLERSQPIESLQLLWAIISQNRATFLCEAASSLDRP